MDGQVGHYKGGVQVVNKRTIASVRKTTKSKKKFGSSKNLV